MEPNINVAVDYIRMCQDWIQEIKNLYNNQNIGMEEFADMVDIKTDNIEVYLNEIVYELIGSPIDDQHREDRYSNDDLPSYQNR